MYHYCPSSKYIYIYIIVFVSIYTQGGSNNSSRGGLRVLERQVRRNKQNIFGWGWGGGLLNPITLLDPPLIYNRSNLKNKSESQTTFPDTSHGSSWVLAGIYMKPTINSFQPGARRIIGGRGWLSWRSWLYRHDYGRVLQLTLYPVNRRKHAV